MQCMGVCSDNCGDVKVQGKQKRSLTIVLWINAIMFIVIVIAALKSRSSSLLSDSLDNLGDAITYGLSLYAVTRTSRKKAQIALFKGLLIFIAAIVVMVQIVHKICVPQVPNFEIMGIFSLAGLVANGVCLFLLWRHRHEDINMRSVWECSRNDIMSNVSVFVAAALVWYTHSMWPDIVVAVCLVILLLRSAWRVMKRARKELAVPLEKIL